MKIKDALIWATKELNSFVERPRLEAEILLSYLLNQKREFLILNDTKEIDFKKFKFLINRRKNYEPIEYIIKSVSFYKYNFFIDKGALIPRPESEILVEKAIELIKKYNIKELVEIGIGSGALSICIAKECDVKIIASDISKEAIKIAKKNIEKFNLNDKIEVKNSSLLDSIKTPQLIISNPPYIDKEFKLDKNILEYEPHEALFAPKKGLEILFNILDIIKEKNVKYAICEIGYDQKNSILEYARKIGLNGELNFYKDYSSFDRGFIFINKN